MYENVNSGVSHDAIIFKEHKFHHRRVGFKITCQVWHGNTEACTDHGDESPDELEVHEVVGVDRRRRVDLQAVVAVVGVLEEAIHRIEHLMRNVEEPLSET